MSRKDKDITALSDRFYEKVFKIKLKGAQDIPLNNEFMKAIEQEYAIKYLESLNIEPTKANIAQILKNNPLKSCNFGAGWNSSGRVAESLTIIARQRKPKTPVDSKAHQAMEAEEAKADKKSTVQSNLADSKSLKMMRPEEKRPTSVMGRIGGPSLLRSKTIAATNVKYSKVMDDEENEQPEIMHRHPIDYDMNTIKKKYLYPFNDTKQKKAYQALSDDPTTSYLPQVDTNATNDVLNSHKYYFPFSHIKLQANALRELQQPLKITTNDILAELKKFIEKFPFDAFPQNKTKEESEHTVSTFQTPPESGMIEKPQPTNKGRQHTFIKDVDVEKCKQILVTEELARVVGVVGHFAYWQVFGHLSPVQPDLATKKQMILIAIEQINNLRKKVKNLKLWSLFIHPMVLLTIRMMVEFVLKNKYPAFFDFDRASDIGLEKVNILITNMFDPNMLYSRFPFFESEIDAVNKKFTEHMKENKYRAKRLYGTNPYLDLYFPKPESGFVRTIKYKKDIVQNQQKASAMSKTHAGGFGGGTLSNRNADDNQDSKAHLQQSYKVKMFQVLLDKVSDNVPDAFKGRGGALNYEAAKH